MVPMARILVVGVVFIAAPCAFAELKPKRQPVSASAAARANFLIAARATGGPIFHRASYATSTCRRKIEMSPGVQSRDDTRVPGGHEEERLGLHLGRGVEQRI